jgi:hypothetical protein
MSPVQEFSDTSVVMHRTQKFQYLMGHCAVHFGRDASRMIFYLDMEGIGVALRY